jgi:hypothetical protein
VIIRKRTSRWSEAPGSVESLGAGLRYASREAEFIDVDDMIDSTSRSGCGTAADRIQAIRTSDRNDPRIHEDLCN